jgi:hypothetical protein
MEENTDNQLITEIKKNGNSNINFIDEFASVLDINYDAAYRRINLKSKLSFSEAVKLCKHYNISLNKFINQEDKNIFFVKKTNKIINIQDLITYFNNFTALFNKFQNNETSNIYYSANDLPLFYFLNDNLLLRFKMFIWLNLLETDIFKKHITFENYNLPRELLVAAFNAGKAYDNINITELWSYGIIERILKQIRYFYDLNLINYNNSIQLCKDLKETIKGIELNAQNGYRDNLNKTKYNLYYNEILSLNNNIYLKSSNNSILFTPYSHFSYFAADDINVCSEYEIDLQEQFKTSKFLSKTGLKERILFFNPIHKQIDELIKHLDFIKNFPLKNI